MIEQALLARAITLRAPREGTVRFLAPRQLCGELEVFDAGEGVCAVADVCVRAPRLAFVVGHLVTDGDAVDEGQPLVELRFA